AVQDRHMEMVWHIVEMMRPVAGDELGPALNMIVGDDRLVALARFEHIPARQRRLLLGRPHIGEDQAVALLDRIPGLPGIVAMTPALRFAGLLEAAAFGIEQPAVIAAADAALLDLAVVERGAAMGAARIKQPGTAFALAEEDQILAQGANGFGTRRRIAAEADRVPIAAEQRAHPGPGRRIREIAVDRARPPAIRRALIDCLARRHRLLPLPRMKRLFRCRARPVKYPMRRGIG